MSNKSLSAYCKFLENLTIDDVSKLNAFVRNDIRFRDPFNDCLGLKNFEAILLDMFKYLAPFKFRVLDHSLIDEQDGSNTAFLHWHLQYTLKSRIKEKLEIEGVSKLSFDSEGKVSEHYDFWDAASNVYEKFPVIGFALKRFKGRISSDTIY